MKKHLQRLNHQNPVATQVLILAVAALVLAVLAFGLASTDGVTWKELRTAAPAVSSVIAALSLVLTGFAVSSAATRQRRERTIDAWHSWQEDRAKDRRLLEKCLGADAISEAQVAELRQRPIVTFSAYGGVALDPKGTIELRDGLVRILNGLERLAVGCELGIYDTKTLGLLSNRIVTKTVGRYDKYLDSARVLNPRAYKALRALDVEFRRIQGKEQ